LRAHIPARLGICPGCKTTLSKINIASLQLVPSKTSSDLLRNQSTNYVLAEFDATLQPIQAGVQQAGFANKVKAVSSSGHGSTDFKSMFTKLWGL
jgi:formate-dependent phosphoribosylglycinamide formyltransferase (GAR transformylase)